MSIAFFEIEDWEKEYLKDKFPNQEVSFFSEPLSKSTVANAKGATVVSPFIYSALDKNILGALPDCRFIATRSTGFDHIDLQTAKERGIAVSNVPVYGSNTVAEHAFALMLALAKRIYPSVQRTKQGDFSLSGLTGFDLKGKILGVVGMGKIGKEVADIAKAFEMQVIAYDPHENQELAQAAGFSYVSLDDLLEQSDIITLHTVLNDSTKHLINADNISKIKKGAYLINTARGELVETDALVKALDNGILAGAGLDVMEEECYIKEERQLLSSQFPETCDVKTLLENNILLHRDNVLITPHNAFNSKEALVRILDTTVDNIRGFLDEKPINIVS